MEVLILEIHKKMSIIKHQTKKKLENAKGDSNSNIPSQPIPPQETAKTRESFREETGKKYCNIFQILLQSHS